MNVLNGCHGQLISCRILPVDTHCSVEYADLILRIELITVFGNTDFCSYSLLHGLADSQGSCYSFAGQQA